MLYLPSTASSGVQLLPPPGLGIKAASQIGISLSERWKNVVPKRFYSAFIAEQRGAVYYWRDTDLVRPTTSSLFHLRRRHRRRSEIEEALCEDRSPPIGTAQ